MNSKMRLHHIGVVVNSVEKQSSYYQDFFGYTIDQPKIYDPVQDVFVAFLRNDHANVLLELIEPASNESPVASALARGGGLNHLCYSVNNITRAIDDLVNKGALLIRPPVPAVAFENRRIAFLYTPLREIVELVEKGGE